MRREFSPAVKSAAMKRAVYRCERCQATDNLEFHHRGHNADNSLFNTEVLCRRCHLAEELKRRIHRGGRGQTTPPPTPSAGS